jgi:ABC-type glycerol-3-phosphate transport system substrate-binding protein
LTLLIAAAMLLTILPGCEYGAVTETVAPNSPSAVRTPPPPALTESAPPIPAELPHTGDRLAVNAYGTRKYAMNGNRPRAAYDYDLPLTSGLTVFTMLAPSPPYGLSDGDAGGYRALLRDSTGVKLDYALFSGGELSRELATAVAAASVPDIVSGGYGVNLDRLMSDGLTLDLRKYEAYMPNYLYQFTRFDDDPQLLTTIYSNGGAIPAFVGLLENYATPYAYMFRTDMLSRVGISYAEINTYNEIYDALTRLKVEFGDARMELADTVERVNGVFLGGMNTGAVISADALPSLRVEDGAVALTTTREIDRQALIMLNAWQRDGLLNVPLRVGEGAERGTVVFAPMATQAINDAVPDDPRAVWDSGGVFGLTEDFEYRYARSLRPWAVGGAVWAISAACANVPLIVTYADYLYSPAGSFNASYGVEGVTFNFNSRGEVRLTELAADAPWTQLSQLAANPLTDVGITDFLRTTYSVKGARLQRLYRSLAVPDYGTGMDYPHAALNSLTPEQTAELTETSADLAAFIADSYFAFIDGSRSLETWDDYTAQLAELGLLRIEALYQSAPGNSGTRN